MAASSRKAGSASISIERRRKRSHLTKIQVTRLVRICPARLYRRYQHRVVHLLESYVADPGGTAAMQDHTKGDDVGLLGNIQDDLILLPVCSAGDWSVFHIIESKRLVPPRPIHTH